MIKKQPFTEEDKQKILNAKRLTKLELSSGEFFLNGTGNEDEEEKDALRSSGVIRAVMEPLGEKIAEKLGLNHLNYHCIKIKDRFFVLSEYIENLQTADFYLLDEFSDTSDLSLYDIWYVLEKNNIECEELMKDIIKMYFMDILLLNDDRKGANWAITNEPIPRLLTFDNEFFLAYNTFYTMRINSQFGRKTDDKIEDLKVFIRESSSEFVELIEQIFEIITSKELESMIKEIFNDLELSEEERLYFSKYIERFKSNYEEIKNSIFKEKIESPEIKK